MFSLGRARVVWLENSGGGCLLGEENLVRECCASLHSIVLHAYVSDKWI